MVREIDILRGVRIREGTDYDVYTKSQYFEEYKDKYRGKIKGVERGMLLMEDGKRVVVYSNGDEHIDNPFKEIRIPLTQIVEVKNSELKIPPKKMPRA